MAESAKTVAQQVEGRLDKVAESVRGQFARIIETRFTDKIKDGLFDPDHGIDQVRADERHRKQGGSPR